MTTQAAIQKHVWRGFAVLARQAGAPCAWYRPSGTGSPIAAGNLLGTVQAYIDTQANFASVNPQARKSAQVVAAFDGTLVRIGDYLIDTASVPAPWGPTFVATMDSFRGSALIQCNATLTLARQGQAAPSTAFYGGANRNTLATAWPASVLPGGRGTRDASGLPGVERDEGVAILLPTTFPAQPRPGDVLTDTQVEPVDYLVSGAWLTSLGWQVTAIIRTP